MTFLLARALPNLRACAFLVFLSFLIPDSARAEVLFSDGFAYTNGALTITSGGTWVNANGPQDTLVVTNNRALLQKTGDEDVAAIIPGGPYGASTNVPVYWSFRLTVTETATSTDNFFAHLATSGTTFRSRVFATTNGATPGAFRMGIANASTTPASTLPIELSPNSEVVVIVKYAPSTAISTLWVNPTNESDASVTAGDAATTASISRIALRQNNKIGVLFMDDIRVGTNFADVHGTAAPTLPSFTVHPQSQSAREGRSVVFSVSTTGTQPIFYQWLFNGAPIQDATNSTLILENLLTNYSGIYSAIASNTVGWTESDPATLTVEPVPPWDGSLKVLTWNVKGNGAADWSTNAAQVQAISRVIAYLEPDVITFNEIPYNLTWEMTNWVAAFWPGWRIATNSGTDGFIRSVIASRFEILSSTKHLDGASLSPYGSGQFTRDLFQARIRVPGYAQPVDVFTTHLKATTSSPQSDADKRGAEAMAVSNFLANVYLPTNNGAKYVLTGDLNEDVLRPATNRYVSKYPIQNLVNPQTGLVLTTPVNPITEDDFTLDIEGPLNVRFDYVLPCSALGSNISYSQVFRSDVLTNPPVSGVFPGDSVSSSDHLPVLVTFQNPGWPIQPLVVNGDYKLLSWETEPGENYRIIGATNLHIPMSSWEIEVTNYTATSYVSTAMLVRTSAVRFFSIQRLP